MQLISKDLRRSILSDFCLFEITKAKFTITFVALLARYTCSNHMKQVSRNAKVKEVIETTRAYILNQVCYARFYSHL